VTTGQRPPSVGAPPPMSSTLALVALRIARERHKALPGGPIRRMATPLSGTTAWSNVALQDETPSRQQPGTGACLHRHALAPCRCVAVCGWPGQHGQAGSPLARAVTQSMARRGIRSSQAARAFPPSCAGATAHGRRTVARDKVVAMACELGVCGSLACPASDSALESVRVFRTR